MNVKKIIQEKKRDKYLVYMIRRYGVGKYKQYIQEKENKQWYAIQKMCLESEAVEEVLQSFDEQMTNGKMFLPSGYSWIEFEDDVRELWQEVWYDKQQEARNEYEQEQNNN